MKGMSLPINLIVIIAIAVLVLVILAAFFSGYFFQQTDVISLQTEFDKGCNALRSVYDCNPDRVPTIQTAYVPAGETGGVYLNRVCAEKGIKASSVGGVTVTDNQACAKACGCQV